MKSRIFENKDVFENTETNHPCPSLTKEGSWEGSLRFPDSQFPAPQFPAPLLDKEGCPKDGVVDSGG